MAKLYLAKADETEGEHSRLIEFLVRADDLEEAHKLAWESLRGEWMEEPDSDDGERIEFFGGEIAIDSLSIREVSEEEAIQNFTRCTTQDSPEMNVADGWLEEAYEDKHRAEELGE